MNYKSEVPPLVRKMRKKPPSGLPVPNGSRMSLENINQEHVHIDIPCIPMYVFPVLCLSAGLPPN